MKHRDDEELKSYLRQFRPLHAEPLPIALQRRSPRRLTLALWAGAGAALVILGALGSRLLPRHQTDVPQLAGATRVDNPQPLTVYTANQILSRAPSTKAALDDMAFPRQTVSDSEGTQSALAVLSKEDRL